MSVMGTRPMSVERNVDQSAIVYQWFQNATPQSITNGQAPVNLTGYTFTITVRINLSDVSPVVTYSLTAQGGGAPDATGTIQIALTNAQTQTLYSLLPVANNNGAYGWYDVMLVSPGNVHTSFIGASQLEVLPVVTHP